MIQMNTIAQSFIHPEDQAALAKLKAVPIFDQCLKAVMKAFPENLLLGESIANKLMLGPNQLPEYYEMLVSVCKSLDIPIPYLFLENDPRPNAYTYGDS